MKALIIGSNGYIGRHLTLTLQAHNITTYCCDLQAQAIDEQANYKQVSIGENDSLAHLNFEVDLVFLLAGLNGTKAGFEQYVKYIGVNEIGMLNVLQQIKNRQSKARVIFLSSRLVYKGQQNQPLAEEAAKEFKTIYAINKFACEQYLKIYQNSFNIPFTILRLCVPYGNLIDEAYSYGTIGFMLGKARNKQAIPLYGGGVQKRTFSHIEDVCALITGAAMHPKALNQTYNIGSPDALSLAEVAQMIAQKYAINLLTTDWPTLDLAIESGDTIFDGTKLEQLLNYKYKHDVKTWLGGV